MTNWVSNCPISGPIPRPDIKPDVDFNGIMWSYQYGLVFDMPTKTIPFKEPVPPIS